MRSPLCDAVARCHLRRLRRAVAAAPLPAAVAATLVVFAPLALVRVGRAVGDELAGAAGSAGVADALVLGPMLAAAAAGAALAVSFPGPSALGQQLAAGPGGETVAVLACLLVPALVGALVVLPSLVALCFALAVELPGGALSGVALAVAVVAAVPAGAIVAEGGLAAASRRRRRPLAIGAGAVAWAGVGVVAGAAPLGPFAVVGPALRGTASSWSALLVAVVGMVALVVAWGRLVVSRPARRSRPAGRSRSLGRAGRLSEPAALAALMSRRHDVRCATVAAIGFGSPGSRSRLPPERRRRPRSCWPRRRRCSARSSAHSPCAASCSAAAGSGSEGRETEPSSSAPPRSWASPGRCSRSRSSGSSQRSRRARPGVRPAPWQRSWSWAPPQACSPARSSPGTAKGSATS